MTDHIFMLAGEPSGDKLGGMIIKEMQKRGISQAISGVGGVDMQGLGLTSVFPMEELSIIGITNALKNYAHLKKRLRQLVHHIKETKPRFVLTIDSKAFSLRLGRELKKVMDAEGWHVPVIHLVAPTVWAWAPWRAKSLSQSVDQLLCLFPFETSYFTKYGVDAHAVGHPSLNISWPTKAKARTELSLHKDDLLLGLFPGSRRREVASILPDMCEALKLLHADFPHLKAMLPAAAPVEPLIKEFLTPEDGITVVPETERYQVMKAADYGLICSGTVTLETALAGLQGSTFYRTDALTSLIGKCLVDRSKIVLPNAITGEEIYPLFLNKEFNADLMARQVSLFLGASGNDKKDLSSKIKTALTPDNNLGKRGLRFEENVVNKLDEIPNGR